MTRRITTHCQSIWRIFRWPLVINSISLLGLISALIGNGLFDLLSWMCLSGVVILMVYAASGTTVSR